MSLNFLSFPTESLVGGWAQSPMPQGFSDRLLGASQEWRGRMWGQDGILLYEWLFVLSPIVGAIFDEGKLFSYNRSTFAARV